MTTKTLDVTLIDRKNRAVNGLELMDTPDAKGLLAQLDERVVNLNLAEEASAKADTVAKAEAEVESTEADAAAVLAVIPFMVRSFDSVHYAKLPKAETYANTSVDYRREHMLPVLRSGGKLSLVMADALEEAITREDRAKHNLASAGARDAQAKEREKLARKELNIAIHKAEVYIQANTSPGDPARLAIKRPHTPDTRTPEEKARALRDQADKLLEKARKREEQKAGKAARKAGKGGVTAPVAGQLPPVTPPVPPALTVVGA